MQRINSDACIGIAGHVAECLNVAYGMQFAFVVDVTEQTVLKRNVEVRIFFIQILP